MVTKYHRKSTMQSAPPINEDLLPKWEREEVRTGSEGCPAPIPLVYLHVQKAAERSPELFEDKPAAGVRTEPTSGESVLHRDTYTGTTSTFLTRQSDPMPRIAINESRFQRDFCHEVIFCMSSTVFLALPSDVTRRKSCLALCNTQDIHEPSQGH